MPGPAEDATAAAAAIEADTAADAKPAHQDGLQSETPVTSDATTRSKRHGPDSSEEESKAKRPKQELFEEEQQRAKQSRQEPSEEEACIQSAQLNRKHWKADSAQNDAHTTNTAGDSGNAELAESAQQSNGANHTDSTIEHKLDADAGPAAELNSDSDCGSESQSQGEKRHFSICDVCGKLVLCCTHEHTVDQESDMHSNGNMVYIMCMRAIALLLAPVSRTQCCLMTNV